MACRTGGGRRANRRLCRNQTITLDNYGFCQGGVGAIPASARSAVANQGGISPTRSCRGNSRYFSPIVPASSISRCKPCANGESSVINSNNGKLTCDPSLLPRSQLQNTNMHSMFPRSVYPVVSIRRRFNYPLRN